MKTEFTITKEQIFEIISCAPVLESVFKKLIPEAFEDKPVPGKWYVLVNHQDIIIFFSEESQGKAIGYGLYEEKWSNQDSHGWTFTIRPTDWREATTKEVEEALKKEAIKRGFVPGCKFKFNGNTFDLRNTISFPGNFIFYSLKNQLYLDAYVVFEGGIWAEVIKDPMELTHEQIEEKLGYAVKIVIG